MPNKILQMAPQNRLISLIYCAKAMKHKLKSFQNASEFSLFTKAAAVRAGIHCMHINSRGVGPLAFSRHSMSIKT